MKIILPWTTDNNCELCHDEAIEVAVKKDIEKEEHSCCQTKKEIKIEEKKKEEKKDCCKEKEFLIKNDLKINKVVYLILSKIDNKIKHIDRFISFKINSDNISNIILIPPNLRIILQSLTI